MLYTALVLTLKDGTPPSTPTTPGDHEDRALLKKACDKIQDLERQLEGLKISAGKNTETSPHPTPVEPGTPAALDSNGAPGSAPGRQPDAPDDCIVTPDGKAASQS